MLGLSKSDVFRAVPLLATPSRKDDYTVHLRSQIVPDEDFTASQFVPISRQEQAPEKMAPEATNCNDDATKATGEEEIETIMAARSVNNAHRQSGENGVSMSNSVKCLEDQNDDMSKVKNPMPRDDDDCLAEYMRLSQMGVGEEEGDKSSEDTSRRKPSAAALAKMNNLLENQRRQNVTQNMRLKERIEFLKLADTDDIDALAIDAMPICTKNETSLC